MCVSLEDGWIQGVEWMGVSVCLQTSVRTVLDSSGVEER